LLKKEPASLSCLCFPQGCSRLTRRHARAVPGRARTSRCGTHLLFPAAPAQDNGVSVKPRASVPLEPLGKTRPAPVSAGRAVAVKDRTSAIKHRAPSIAGRKSAIEFRAPTVAALIPGVMAGIPIGARAIISACRIPGIIMHTHTSVITTDIHTAITVVTHTAISAFPLTATTTGKGFT